MAKKEINLEQLEKKIDYIAVQLQLLLAGHPVGSHPLPQSMWDNHSELASESAPPPLPADSVPPGHFAANASLIDHPVEIFEVQEEVAIPAEATLTIEDVPAVEETTDAEEPAADEPTAE